MASPGPDRRSRRFLFGGYVVVVASFIAASVYTAEHIREIDVASDEIARDAMPTIRCLAEARHILGQFEIESAAFAAVPVTPAARVAAEAPLRALAEQVGIYLALPLFPGERPFWEDVRRGTSRFVGAANRMLGQADAGDARLARETFLREVRPAAAHLHELLSRDLDFNARNGSQLAEHIKAVRARGLWLSLSLGILCGGIALLAGRVVAGQLRRHEALVSEHERMMEERAGELEAFAGRVAHDIMNPTASAQLAIDLELRRRQAAGEPAGEGLERARRSLRRIQTLVAGLLGFARAGARPEPGAAADVVEVVHDVVSGAEARATAAGMIVGAELVPGTVACAKGVLTSLVANLLDNAIKYARRDGRVVIRAAPDAAAIRVEVEDDGPGLPPDLGDRVFEPYVRGGGRDVPGLGLGLATVKRLAEAHGGHVGVCSEPGRGTTFWFELPRAAAVSESASMRGSARG
ncbi:histidine kinase [Anaeromyxobacter sp. K]|nr:histidine kinase [Anaeromyxobacter sp. K]